MLTATVFALAAAVLHAGWNLMAKRAAEPFLALWAQFVVAGAIGGVGLVALGGVTLEALPYALLGGLIHIPYLAMLARAYDDGDFSLAYPIARGGGAMIAAIGGVALLDDSLSVASALGIGVVVVGMALLGWGADRRHLTTALVVAATIGAYTLADSKGTRIAGSQSYAFASFLSTAVAITAYGLGSRRGGALLGSVRANWRVTAVAGAATVVTYSLVLAAVRRAPVGYVAALRESSVLLAAFVGWRYLDETRGRQRLAAAGTIVAGLTILVAAR